MVGNKDFELFCTVISLCRENVSSAHGLVFLEEGDRGEGKGALA